MGRNDKNIMKEYHPNERMYIELTDEVGQKERCKKIAFRESVSGLCMPEKNICRIKQIINCFYSLDK